MCAASQARAKLEWWLETVQFGGNSNGVGCSAWGGYPPGVSCGEVAWFVWAAGGEQLQDKPGSRVISKIVQNKGLRVGALRWTARDALAGSRDKFPPTLSIATGA